MEKLTKKMTKNMWKRPENMVNLDKKLDNIIQNNGETDA